MPEETTCARCGAAMPPGILVRGMCPRCLLALGLEPEGEPQEGSEEPGIGELRPPAYEDLAPLLPGYELEWLLGRGGMGFVYRARQKNLDRPVALKLLPASLGRDPAFADRFEREARTLARLDHPGIVRVIDFGRAGEHHFLAMELVDGVDLRRLIRSREVGPRQALEIVMQVCDALQYAHDEGVVHRDVKPENVLVDRRGRVKVADFGLAKLMRTAPGRPALTRTGAVMGTPHYMAPEQLERPLEVDHRADLYALGVLFYELLTGELPVGRFDPPSKRVGVDVRLDEVVLKALEKAPERRYQQASEVRTDVQHISASDAPGRVGRPSPRGSPFAAPETKGGAGGVPSAGGGRRRSQPLLGCLLGCGCSGMLAVALLMLAVLPARHAPPSPERAVGPPAAPVPAGEMTAQQVLFRAAKTYREARTYQDEGEVMTLYIHEDRTHTQVRPFSTAFVRDGELRELLRYEFHVEGRRNTPRYVVWSDGKRIRSWWTLQPEVQELDSFNEALGPPGPISGGSATKIPGLLVAGMRSDALDLVDPEIAGVEAVDGIRCIKITGMPPISDIAAGGTPIHPTTLWVDAESFLIRRIVERRHVDPARLRERDPSAFDEEKMGPPDAPFDAEQTLTYRPRIDQDVPRDRFDFEPPR